MERRTVVFPSFLSFTGWGRINDAFRYKGINSLKILDLESNYRNKAPARLEETEVKVPLRQKFPKKVQPVFQHSREIQRKRKLCGERGKGKHLCVVASMF